ncbi:MAG: hypothetical protein ABS876_00460 [Ruminococcus sp.]
MRVDERLFSRLQNYMLVGVSVTLMFLVVNSVFSSGILRAGDRDIFVDGSLNSIRPIEYGVITYEEQLTEPSTGFTPPDVYFHEVTPVVGQVTHAASANNTQRAAVASATVPTTKVNSVQVTTQATTAPLTTVVTEPTEVTTTPSTTVPSTTAFTTASSTAPSSTGASSTAASSTAASTEPTESTHASSSVDPSASTMPSSSIDPSASTVPSSSVDPSASTVPSSSVDPSSGTVPTSTAETTIPTTGEHTHASSNPIEELIIAIEHIFGGDENETTEANTEITNGESTAIGTASKDATSGSVSATKAADSGKGNTGGAVTTKTTTSGAKTSAGAVQTGDLSMALLILAVVVSMTVGVYFTKRKDK